MKAVLSFVLIASSGLAFADPVFNNNYVEGFYEFGTSRADGINPKFDTNEFGVNVSFSPNPYVALQAGAAGAEAKATAGADKLTVDASVVGIGLEVFPITTDNVQVGLAYIRARQKADTKLTSSGVTIISASASDSGNLFGAEVKVAAAPKLIATLSVSTSRIFDSTTRTIGASIEYKPQSRLGLVLGVSTFSSDDSDGSSAAVALRGYF